MGNIPGMGGQGGGQNSLGGQGGNAFSGPSGGPNINIPDMSQFGSGGAGGGGGMGGMGFPGAQGFQGPPGFQGPQMNFGIPKDGFNGDGFRK